ncbi:UNVERIFIED_CONTAM: hypothetical protein K2H54_015132 [Gekko kuhli]
MAEDNWEQAGNQPYETEYLGQEQQFGKQDRPLGSLTPGPVSPPVRQPNRTFRTFAMVSARPGSALNLCQ